MSLSIGRIGAMILGLAVVLPDVRGFADGTDWPQLFGPRVSAAVEESLRAPRLRELWRRPVGSGFSGISVEAERGYTGESDTGGDFAVAFDVRTGRTLWRVRLGDVYRGHDGSRDGPIATPAVAGGRVFAVSAQGLVLALDAASGRELWRHDLVTEREAKAPSYGFGASPVVEGGLVVFHVGGAETSGLLAYEAVSGRLAWQTRPSSTKGDSTGYTTPVPAVIAGVRQLVSLGHDRVYALRPADGGLLWSHDIAEPEEPTRSPLVLEDGRIVLPRSSDTRLLEVAPEGGGWKTRELWRSPRLKGGLSPNAMAEGSLFGFSGQYLLCVDAKTGEPVWRHKANAGSLIRVGRHLVVLGEQSGLLRVVEATPAGFRTVAEAKALAAGAQSSTGPSYAGGRVFVRNTEEMVAFAVEDGASASREGNP